jgi:hypothetical protein
MKQQAVAAGSDAADAWYNSEEAVAALKQTGDSAGVARALAALPAGQRTSYLAAAADAGAANPGVAMLFLQVLPQPGGVLVVCRWRAGGVPVAVVVALPTPLLVLDLVLRAGCCCCCCCYFRWRWPRYRRDLTACRSWRSPRSAARRRSRPAGQSGGPRTTPLPGVRRPRRC